MRADYQAFDPQKKVLVTGGAGFIGYHLSRRLLEQGARVTGFDNLNDYYPVDIKLARLGELKKYPGYTFIKGDLAAEKDVAGVFEKAQPDIVVNLGAQAGVRYSIENPRAYIEANIVGFFHILEACRHRPVEHLLFASSSSVYGANRKVPYAVEDKADRPVSLYAATKRADELMAYTYSHLYGIPATGLRFFTVYGPLGRPDMAYFSFTERILAGKPIRVFNGGDMYRDFTYIDDVAEAVEKMLCNPPEKKDGARYKLYNIGNHHPEKLADFIGCLEDILGRKAVKEYLPMQPGDVYETYADVDELIRDFGFRTHTPLRDGLTRFADWYRAYYGIG